MINESYQNKGPLYILSLIKCYIAEAWISSYYVWVIRTKMRARISMAVYISMHTGKPTLEYSDHIPILYPWIWWALFKYLYHKI